MLHWLCWLYWFFFGSFPFSGIAFGRRLEPRIARITRIFRMKGIAIAERQAQKLMEARARVPVREP